MATLHLTPQDHGRWITPAQWATARQHSKRWKYEVIDGRLAVSPPISFTEDFQIGWLNTTLHRHGTAHPGQMNYLSLRCAVRVHGRPAFTEVQPDLGVYLIPNKWLDERLHWHDIEPFLVIDLLTNSPRFKDTIPRVELYLLVPGIREYWLVDPNPNWREPTLTVYRRRGNRWQKPIEVAFGEVYETPKLLPGFRLVVDSRAT